MGEQLRPTLGGLTIVASVVGLVVLLLNPPSLSGAEDLLAIVAVAAALVLVSAWATVALIGRDGMSEREFERVVERSERLAGEPDPAASEAAELADDPAAVEPRGEFDDIVADAIDRLPEEFRRLLEDTPVIVSRHGRAEGAYGHYYGDTVARRNFEARIILYADTLERDFGHDPALLEAQIERTLRHELAHHLGWRERGVRDLGL